MIMDNDIKENDYIELRETRATSWRCNYKIVKREEGWTISHRGEFNNWSFKRSLEELLFEMVSTGYAYKKIDCSMRVIRD